MASIFCRFLWSVLNTYAQFTDASNSVGTVNHHAASSQVLNELAAAAYAGVEVLKDRHWGFRVITLF